MPEIAGKGALFADPTDSIALADGLKSVLDSPAKAAALVRLGSENAERFSWDKTARHYQDLFTHMLARC
jgi:glycosyltransferase involved in cell wall biosynthesis